MGVAGGEGGELDMTGVFIKRTPREEPDMHRRKMM